MAQFEFGKVIMTDSCEAIKIVKHLTSGGRYNVYGVEYGGKKMAFRWYES